MSNTVSPSSARPLGRFRWRIVDLVVAAVLAVASGVLFWAWDAAWTPLSKPFEALVPGLSGLLGGVWLIAAVLVGIIVRKPGAAVFAELVAATVEALLPGNQWGAVTLVSGLVQGLGAELVFAILLYRVWTAWSAMLAGAGAGLGLSILDLTLYYAGAKPEFAIIYIAASLVSGALLAGLVSWLLVRALAPTGALDRFAAGRTRRALV